MVDTLNGMIRSSFLVCRSRRKGVDHQSQRV